MLEFYRSLVLLQLLPLLAVVLIYLRTTFLDGLEPQKSAEEIPPADRLVVFVRDGLSAQTFFANRCHNVPQLRDIFLDEGLVGVSRPETTTYHSHSPYVALFSGVNEDAATVARGWLWKPKAFDSLFNRSNRNFAWTTPELASHFPKMTLRRVKGIQTEEFVGQSVSNFLAGESHHLLKTKEVLFFVHLTGEEPSAQNLEQIEANVLDMYRRFENWFPDRRTAYLLTSNLGDPQLKSECNLAVESPFVLWGSGVAHVTSLKERSFVANATGYRLPLHVLNPPQLTSVMSALLGLPPPVNSRGMLPQGMLNVSKDHQAKVMLINAQQLLAQARRLKELHPRTTPAFWLDFRTMNSFLKNSKTLLKQRRFSALLDYSCNYMPLLVKGIDYYKDYYRRVLVWAVTLAGVGWLCCVRCHLAEVHSQEVTPFKGMVWFRGVSRLLTGLLVVFMMLERIPLVVQAILLLPSLYWMITLKIWGQKPKMMCRRSGIWSALLVMTCLGGFIRRPIMALGYLGFAGYANRDAFRVRGPQFFLWLLMVLGLSFVSLHQESLGCSQSGALLFSICLTLLRPLACGVYLNPLTWLINITMLLSAVEYVLVGWLPWATYAASCFYLGYVALWQRRSLQASEWMFFNLSTLYTLTCTSYESVVIQMLAMELQLGLRMKLERNETIGAKMAAHYVLVYSWFSLFVIGSVPAFDDFLDILHETSFGDFSPTYFLIMALKLLVPWLLLLCILAGNYKDLWSHERQIFVWLLLLSNAMSLVLLHRVRSNGPWREILSRFAEFGIVQVFPLVWLLLWRLAHHKVGSKWISQLPDRVAIR